jgi:hypothetical protein
MSEGVDRCMIVCMFVGRKCYLCNYVLCFFFKQLIIQGRVAANTLNKQSRTADKGWSSSLGVGRGAKIFSL